LKYNKYGNTSIISYVFVSLLMISKFFGNPKIQSLKFRMRNRHSSTDHFQYHSHDKGLWPSEDSNADRWCDNKSKYDMRVWDLIMKTLHFVETPFRLSTNAVKSKHPLFLIFATLITLHLSSVIHILKQQPNYSFETKSARGGIDAIVTIATGEYSAVHLVSGINITMVNIFWSFLIEPNNRSS